MSKICLRDRYVPEVDVKVVDDKFLIKTMFPLIPYPRPLGVMYELKFKYGD